MCDGVGEYGVECRMEPLGYSLARWVGGGWDAIERADKVIIAHVISYSFFDCLTCPTYNSSRKGILGKFFAVTVNTLTRFLYKYVRT